MLSIVRSPPTLKWRNSLTRRRHRDVEAREVAARRAPELRSGPSRPSADHTTGLRRILRARTDVRYGARPVLTRPEIPTRVRRPRRRRSPRSRSSCSTSRRPGTAPSQCAITEIGAVKYRAGECLGALRHAREPGRADPAVHHRAHRHHRSDGAARPDDRRGPPFAARVHRERGARRPQPPLRHELPRRRAPARDGAPARATRASTRSASPAGSSATR